MRADRRIIVGILTIEQGCGQLIQQGKRCVEGKSLKAIYKQIVTGDMVFWDEN